MSQIKVNSIIPVSGIGRTTFEFIVIGPALIALQVAPNEVPIV